MAHRDKTRKTIQKKDRLAIFQRDRYLCGYCETSKKRKASSLVVDHIIPVRYGGAHNETNWVTACRPCNRTKWHYAPRESGAPKLLRFAGKQVAKVTWMAKGGNFPKRFPKISFKK